MGNDYIGTCPYAFLIHVLSLHNEFLARESERITAEAVESLGKKMLELQSEESRDGRLVLLLRSASDRMRQRMKRIRAARSK